MRSSALRRNSGPKILLAVTVIGLASLCSSHAAWAQRVGTITQLSGGAQVQRGGAILGAALSMAIQLHDQVSTGPASTLTITLIDNSTLSLYASSTLVLDENVVAGGVRQRTLVRLVRGSVRAIVTVAHILAPNNFDIQTPNAVLGVRGTDFDAIYTEGSVRPGYEGCQRYTDVVVRDGIVAVNNLANPAAVIEVSAGYETTVPCLLPPLTAGPIGIAGTAAPGAAAGSRTGNSGAGTSAAAAVAGFAAPPPGVGSSPPPAPPPVRILP